MAKKTGANVDSPEGSQSEDYWQKREREELKQLEQQAQKWAEGRYEAMNEDLKEIGYSEEDGYSTGLTKEQQIERYKHIRLEGLLRDHETLKDWAGRVRNEDGTWDRGKNN